MQRVELQLSRCKGKSLGYYSSIIRHKYIGHKHGNIVKYCYAWMSIKKSIENILKFIFEAKKQRILVQTSIIFL
jgi:hypothetical protein